MTSKAERVGAWSFSRIGGICGIGFAALIVGANLILVPAGLPVVGADIGKVHTFFTAKAVPVQISSACTPVAWLCALLFGAAAVATLWPRERATGSAWSLVGFAGLLLQNGTFVGVIGVRLALSATPDHAPTALWSLHNALFTLNGTFLAAALLGLSLAGLHTGLIPRWHATLGLTAAAGQLLSATLTPLIINHPTPLALISLLTWLMWVVWITTYGITLYRLRPLDAT